MDYELIIRIVNRERTNERTWQIPINRKDAAYVGDWISKTIQTMIDEQEKNKENLNG